MVVIHVRWGAIGVKCYVLSHFSALQWMLGHRDPRVGETALHRNVPHISDAPDARVVEELRWSIEIEGVLDFLVIGDGVIRRSSSVCPHRCTQALPPGSLIPIGCHRADAELYVCSPELAFIQICQCVDTPAAIYLGMNACSDYRFDEFSPGGVVYRAEGTHSIATVKSIGSYLNRAVGLRGVKRARVALPYIQEHARSPKECALGMLFCLPSTWGGFDLGSLAFNESVRVYDGMDRNGEKRFCTRYPDIVIRSTLRAGERRAVFVDYDPDATHSGDVKGLLDSRRRNDMATIRDTPHFTVTSDDAASFDYLEKLADRIRRALGGRMRPALRSSIDSAQARGTLAKARHRRQALWAQFLKKPFSAVIDDLR